ncbi:hypothetical protein [Paenibacillus gallinarum]|uniref:YopX protein domain-containing protein n=1 Tax=Paenibacillus gallinarum TaxID=2762232 RepID=A0ABR8SWP3_9BACL|nr:hypothetical protein [Paenibacillus gallinarum]MBD7967738.1 hypothetical protein [Paenibacillus gallinarum]
MREYKFRGISIEPLVGDDQWVHGLGVHVVELTDGGKEYWLYTANGTYQVDPESVGQYTGVHDDTDEQEELYDGDIAELEYDWHKHTCKVQYCGSGYMFVADTLPDGYLWFSEFIDFDRRYCWAEGTRKLGNIYDHKHLLNLPGEVDHE